MIGLLLVVMLAGSDEGRCQDGLADIRVKSRTGLGVNAEAEGPARGAVPSRREAEAPTVDCGSDRREVSLLMVEGSQPLEASDTRQAAGAWEAFNSVVPVKPGRPSSEPTTQRLPRRDLGICTEGLTSAEVCHPGADIPAGKTLHRTNKPLEAETYEGFEWGARDWSHEA